MWGNKTGKRNAFKIGYADYTGPERVGKDKICGKKIRKLTLSGFRTLTRLVLFTAVLIRKACASPRQRISPIGIYYHHNTARACVCV